MHSFYINVLLCADVVRLNKLIDVVRLNKLIDV